MGDDNTAVNFRDAEFLDKRILEVKEDLLTELREVKEELALTNQRMYDLNREVGGLKTKVQVISGIVGAVTGLITALSTKLGLN